MGHAYTGIVLDPSYGTAIGVIELSSIGERGGDLEITYDDADNEWRPGQLGDSWKQLEASCAVTAVADKRATKTDGSVDESTDGHSQAPAEGAA